MKKILSCCACLAAALIIAGALPADGQDQGGGSYIPGLYVFQNGLGLGSAQDDARVLKELGYAGVSQVTDRGEALANRVAAYDRVGVRVLSVYLDVNDQSIAADVVEPLRDRDALIELTVRKMTPKTVEAVRQTAEMAAGLNIRVALYPHFGFAVATMPQAMELVAEVNHPSLGVMFNLCHFLKSQNANDLEKVLQEAGSRLFAISTSGADVNGTNWDELIQPLDLGDFPQKRLLKALEQIGFRGPVGLQCYGLRGDKRANLVRSMAAWERLIENR